MIPASSAVIVFAKVPGLGISKSRIAASHGQAAADTVYDELLRATSLLVAGLPYHVAFTGSSDPHSLATVFTGALSFFEQRGRALGERLGHAFSHMFELGFTEVCAIGCDCPHMTPGDIREALRTLQSGSDVVVGPAHDGGYYLIGTRPRNDYVFSVCGWETPALLEQTLGVIARQGASHTLLRQLSDIDSMEDYTAWKKGADTT